MQRKKRRFFTKQELVQIYNDSCQNIESYVTARRLDTRPGTVRSAAGYLADYLSGKRQYGLNTPTAYVEAANEIKSTILSSDVVPEKKVEQHSDSLQRLESAFAQLQEVMADFIVEEVEKRAGQKVQEKEKALAEQKEKYEQELLRLQTIVVAAKDSSIVGVIRKKMTELATY